MQKKATRRYETASRNTEKMFAESLKRLLREMPLEKISVQKLADDCGVNRKTFYYHFDNVNDLLGWMLETDATGAFQNIESCNDPEELLRFCIEYSDQNRRLLKMALQDGNVGFGHLKLYGGCHRIVRLMAEHAQQKQKLDVAEEYADYVIEFYTGALARSLYQYIYHPMPDSRTKTIDYLLALLRCSIPAALAAQQPEK